MRSLLYIYCFVTLYSHVVAQTYVATEPPGDNQTSPYIAVTGGLGLPILKFNSPGPTGSAAYSNDSFNYGGHGEALKGINFNIELTIPLNKPRDMFKCKLGYHTNPFDMAAYTSVPMHGKSPDLPGSIVGGTNLLSQSAGKYNAFDLMGGFSFSTRGKVCAFNFNVLAGAAECTFPNIDYTYSIHYPNTQDTTGSIKVRAQPELGFALQMGCGLRCFITPKISILGNVDIFYCLVDFSFQVDQSGGSNYGINYVGPSTHRDNYSLFNATLGVAYNLGK